MAAARARAETDQPTAGKHVAYGRFQSALLSGALQSGQFVSQRTLVDMLHLSIGALRELLPRLETEGLLTVLPQRGIQITTVDLPMIRDAFQLRTALEREAVIACIRHMSDADIALQRSLHLERLAEWQSNPSDAFLSECQEIDTAFHQTLMETTRNQLLIQANAVNAIRIRLIKRDRISLSRTNFEAAFHDHLRIIDTIAARDREAGTAAIEDHIRNSLQNAIGD